MEFSDGLDMKDEEKWRREPGIIFVFSDQIDGGFMYWGRPSQ
jgi:hypothetical protein